VFSYFAYGLKIGSHLALPELITYDSEEFDVTIAVNRELQIDDFISPEIINCPWSIQLKKDKAVIYVRGTGVFTIENGHKITIVPAPEYTELLARFYLVGTVMAVVLYQREYLVLHSSAVNINGGAVAFLGVSGEGKSSTAATFATYGYPLITDDVAPLDLTAKPPVMYPGFPQVKVGQEIAGALGYNYDTLHSVTTFKDKRALRPKEQFSLAPLPLKRIYVLTSDSEFAIEPIRASEAVTEIARHSRPTTLYHSGGAPHFFQCANLVKQQPIYRLRRPKNLDLLPELVKCVEQDLFQND
jgi:hypothetical protein